MNDVKRIWKKLLGFLPDKQYLQLYYFAKLKKICNLKEPKTFNEKLQWLKLYNRRSEYTVLVDKYRVRDYIKDNIGEEYLIPLLGVWDDPDEIDFDKLPEKFVLKCNHNSGLGICICKNNKKLDIEKTKHELKKGLAEDYYMTGREWPYKNVPRKIIAEQYMEDKNGELNDYKFFCFDGEVDCVMIVTDRAKGDAHYYYMSKDWTILPYGRLTRSLPKDFTLPKPEHLEEMFDIAHRLSQGFPHVRIDLYNVDGHIYFGEYTLYHQGGFEEGFDEASDLHLGSLIKLPPKTSI